MCGLTKSICGTEEEMKNALRPEALDLHLVTTVNCSIALGMPAGTQCNVMTGPGVDRSTLQAQVISPPSQMTEQARSRQNAEIADGEASIHTLLIAAIVLNAILGTMYLAAALVCGQRSRSRRRAKAADDSCASP